VVIINKQGHLISSMLVLITVLSVYITYTLLGLGAIRVVATIFVSVGLFLFGCTLPDFDHPAVQKKLHIKWLGKITKHRGHWHSIIAALVYGGLIFLLMWILNFFYWIYPVIFGIGGYISHLIEDDLNRYKLKSKPKRGFKLW